MQSHQVRRTPYARTPKVLASSGMLDVAMRTAELMRKNRKLTKQLAQLRRDADAFVCSVLSNPENRHFAKMNFVQAGMVPSPSLVVSPNLDFSVMDPSGRLTPVTTEVLTEEPPQKKRKFEVVSEPVPF